MSRPKGDRLEPAILVTYILLIGVLIGGVVIRVVADKQWENKVKSESIITVNSKTYKITEVVATTTYTEK